MLEISKTLTTAITGIRTPRFPALLDAWRDKVGAAAVLGVRVIQIKCLLTCWTASKNHPPTPLWCQNWGAASDKLSKTNNLIITHILRSDCPGVRKQPGFELLSKALFFTTSMTFHVTQQSVRVPSRGDSLKTCSIAPIFKINCDKTTKDTEFWERLDGDEGGYDGRLFALPFCSSAAVQNRFHFVFGGGYKASRRPSTSQFISSIMNPVALSGCVQIDNSTVSKKNLHVIPLSLSLFLHFLSVSLMSLSK